MGILKVVWAIVLRSKYVSSLAGCAAMDYTLTGRSLGHSELHIAAVFSHRTVGETGDLASWNLVTPITSPV